MLQPRPASPAKSEIRPHYRPDIDGLRAVAILSVVAYHASARLLPGGFVGVDIFFVISGFLISSLIFKELDTGGFRFGDFYIRRIRRIFPALILMLTAALIGAQVI
ncbi:MAG TPA: acyltransferase, partial [Hyphomicrobiales bacterium]|nr:acyltransferase [Hyphomicrobiales bacterium]